jgi:hypothetical protein
MSYANVATKGQRSLIPVENVVRNSYLQDVLFGP